MSSERISRQHFINNLQRSGLSKEDSTKAWEVFLRTLETALLNGESVLFPTVMKLEARKRKPRICRSNLKPNQPGEVVCYGERMAWLVRVPKRLKRRTP